MLIPLRDEAMLVHAPDLAAPWRRSEQLARCCNPWTAKPPDLEREKVISHGNGRVLLMIKFSEALT
jgi:hypothetical protein